MTDDTISALRHAALLDGGGTETRVSTGAGGSAGRAQAIATLEKQGHLLQAAQQLSDSDLREALLRATGNAHENETREWREQILSGCKHKIATWTQDA